MAGLIYFHLTHPASVHYSLPHLADCDCIPGSLSYGPDKVVHTPHPYLCTSPSRHATNTHTTLTTLHEIALEIMKKAYESWKRVPTTTSAIIGLDLPYRPPKSPLGAFLWRRRMWLETTIGLSLLEPWEKVLVREYCHFARQTSSPFISLGWY